MRGEKKKTLVTKVIPHVSSIRSLLHIYYYYSDLPNASNNNQQKQRQRALNENRKTATTTPTTTKTKEEKKSAEKKEQKWRSREPAMKWRHQTAGSCVASKQNENRILCHPRRWPINTVIILCWLAFWMRRRIWLWPAPIDHNHTAQRKFSNIFFLFASSFVWANAVLSA